MSRYDETLTAFVLKKQPIGEADALVTWYTREKGKVRAVARSARRLQSRLAFALGIATKARIRLVGRGEASLPILAGAGDVLVFARDFSEEQSVLVSWFLEIVRKSTPDHEKNTALFESVETFFGAVSKVGTPAESAILVARTLIQVLEALGIAVHEDLTTPVYFTVQGGGFFVDTNQADKVPVLRLVWEEYKALKAGKKAGAPTGAVSAELANMLEAFLEYHIERPIRSFSFVSAIINA